LQQARGAELEVLRHFREIEARRLWVHADSLYSFIKLRFALTDDQIYPRLTKLAPNKPIIIAEFGCDIHHRKVTAAAWARAALRDLFSGRWPAIIGFCWWNESWENDDVPAHNSDLIILHDPALRAAFRDNLQKYGDQIQETPFLPSTR